MTRAPFRPFCVAPYPDRPVHEPDGRWAGRTRSGARAEAELIAYVLERYAAGLSLRQIAELTDRTHSAVRNILERAGVQRRGVGAERIRRGAAT